MIPKEIEKQLLKRTRLGNLRQHQNTERPNLIDFASNDYLGLARSPALAAAIYEEWKCLPNKLGSTGSRLLTGDSNYAQQLEQRIAQFHGYEAGTLFSCGYMANVGLLSAITTEKDCVFFDVHIHTSTRNGVRLSKARAFPFKHNDLDSLQNRLKRCLGKGERFICVESIYSTDGSIAPLKECCELAEKYQAHLIVDEAHAVGVFGPHGAGLIAEQILASRVFAQVVTFGKAVGTYGAIVLGSQRLKQALVNFSHSYIYTTALPFYALAAIKCSYDLFPEMDTERDRLHALIKYFNKRANAPIQAIQVPGNATVKELSDNIISYGIDVRPLLSPTVQKGTERLRICLHAFNTEEEVNFLKKITGYAGSPLAAG